MLIRLGAWTANSCAAGGDRASHIVHFAPHNLSGTYTMSWDVYDQYLINVSNCSSTLYYRGMHQHLDDVRPQGGRRKERQDFHC